MTRRRRILLFLLALIPVAATSVLWARSYRRRDRLIWDTDRPDSRRATCQVYSSWGRFNLLSYSRPSPGESGADRTPLSFESGNRADTEPIGEAVRNHLQQAGVMRVNALGFGYGQHVGAMSSGNHVWTAMVIPWWSITAVALALPAYLSYRAARPAGPAPENTPAADPRPPAPNRPEPFQPLRPPPRRPKGYKNP